MTRKPFPKSVETEVLIKSKRKCALCFGLMGDAKEKKGQLAHIDRNPSNAALENAAFLCQKHHDEYDSRSRQTKGLTPNELKVYQENLYEYLASPSPWPDASGSIKHRLNRKVGVSLEVYDRRVTVYRTTIQFVRYVFKDLKPEFQGIFQFATDTDEALFLFDETVAEYLTTLYKKALRLHAIGLMLTRVEADQDTQSLINERTTLAVWFAGQVEQIRTVFAPFLRLA
jgi:hypothetical protein